MLIFIVCASLARGVCAQMRPPAIPITPKPVGSGARALGQSAFIAVADDATAASWNPAGLINLERPEASLVGAWKDTVKDYSATNDGVSPDKDAWSGSEINFMSYAHPLVFGNTDVVLSVNYHQVYDFGVEFNHVIQIPDYEFTTKGRSEGALSAYSLAGGLSMPSYPEISIGASFNWYSQSLLDEYAWKIKATNSTWKVPRPPSPAMVAESIDIYDGFRGHNFTFGLLWDAYERQENLLTLGLVYHTPFTAEVARELVVIYPDPPSLSYPQRMGIDFPSSLGAGASYRISDSLSAAFDVEWKEWSKFETEDRDTGERISSIASNTLTYRLGAEHLTFLEGVSESVLACRGGAFYEPRPAPYDPDPLPVYGLSAGLGWTVREQFSLDFAYQFRWGEGNLTMDAGNFDYRIKEDFFVVSLITYF